MASTIATLRLAATARTTGRGARRNWRHRTSAQDRRGGRAPGSRRSVTPRPASPGCVAAGGSRAYATASSSTAAVRRSSSSSEVKKPTLMRIASRPGIVRAMAKTRAPSSSRAAWASQPAIRNVTSVAIRVARRQDPHARDGRQPCRGQRGHRGAAAMDEVEADVHRQPADGAGHPDDRRSVVAARLEAPGIVPPDCGAAAVRVREAVPATEAGRQPLDRPRVDHERAHPLGPEQPFLRGDRVHVGPEIVEPDRDRTGRLRPVDDDERSARVGQRRDPGDRHDGTGRPQHVRDRDEAGVGRDGGFEGGQRPVVVAVVAGVDEGELDPEPVAQGVQRSDAAGVLVRGRDRATAGAPVGQQRRRVHPVGRRMGQADAADVARRATAATPARASAMRASVSRK